MLSDKVTQSSFYSKFIQFHITPTFGLCGPESAISKDEKSGVGSNVARSSKVRLNFHDDRFVVSDFFTSLDGGINSEDQ